MKEVAFIYPAKISALKYSSFYTIPEEGVVHARNANILEGCHPLGSLSLVRCPRISRQRIFVYLHFVQVGYLELRRVPASLFAEELLRLW